MTSFKARYRKVSPYILVIFGVAVVIFATTIKDREPWRGQLADDHHQLITAEVVKFSTNWYAEDPLKLKFALLELPKSVESTTIQDRMPYVSYPPGAILPIYAIAKVFHHKPTVYLVHDYNLLNHFLIGLALAAIAFVVARGLRLGYGSSTVLASIPLLLTYTLPGPMYFFQNVYFADTAVILPATLFILIEVWQYFNKPQKTAGWLFWMQAALLFYGTLTDWYFVFLAFGAFALRLVRGNYPSLKQFIVKAIAYWLPVVTALCLFAVQVVSLNGGGNLKKMFFARTSSACREYPNMTMAKTYWMGYMPESFGRYAAGILWMSLAISLLAIGYIMYRDLKRRKVSSQIAALVSTITLLVVVPFDRIYVLRCHSIFHDFTTVFFVGAVALVPFVLLPLLLMKMGVIQSSSVSITVRKRRYTILAMPLILLALAFTYTAAEHYRYLEMFPESNLTYSLYGSFISDNVGYKDVIFSPDYKAAALPPHQIIFTNKEIHKISQASDILKITRQLQEEYAVKIFVKDSTTPLKGSIAALVEQAKSQQTIIVNGTPAVLYEIPVSALPSN